MKYKPLLIALAIAVPACAGGWWALARGGGEKVDPAAIAEAARGELTVVVAETGRVQPLVKVDVKSKVAGQVATVHVEEGARVAKGQVLLALDPTDFKRQLAQAEADRAMVAAELQALVAGSRKEDVAEGRAMLAQARSRARRAAEEHARGSKALAAGSLTPREWDTIRAEHRESEAAEMAAASKLARLQAGPRAEEIAQARARLMKADVALAAARDQLAYSVLRSPIAGTVIHRSIEVGEMVTPGVSETGDRKPLLTVADLSKLVVASEINQVDVGKLAVGQPVTVRVSSLPGKTFTGRIHKIAPAAVAGREKDVQLFPVETLLTGQGLGLLRPGMSADIDVVAERKADALLLPIQAVARERGAQGRVTVVTKVRDAWKRESREVTLGSSSDERIEVVKGLKAGEQVLIDPPPAKGTVNQF